MKQPLQILILEDSMTDAELIQRVLLKANMNCSFHLATDKNSFLTALKKFAADIIISDNSLPQFDATEALKITRQQFSHLPFILVTGTVSEEFAADIIKQGADDYILKDRMIRLPAAINAALQHRQSEREKSIALENLLKSEEKYRTFIQRITDAFIALDKNWCYTYLNEQAGELIHHDPNDLIGKNVWEVFPDIVGSSTYKAFHKAMKEQCYISNIDYYQPLDLWQENQIYPSENGLSVFIRDITKKKKAEEEIKKSNERFEMVVSATNDIIWDWDIITNKFWWNKNYYSRFGYDKKNTVLNISSWQDGVHPDDKKRVLSGIQTSLENHKNIWTDEYRFLKADATIAFVLDCGYILYTKKGKPYRMAGAMLDITDRKKAEEQLKIDLDEKQVQAERMSTILNTLPANIALLDAKGFIIDVNDSWKKFADNNNFMGSNYCIGDDYIKIANDASGEDENDGKVVARGVSDVIENNVEEFVYEYPCHSPNLKRWFRMVVTPLQKKEYSGAVVMHIDISEIRRLEEERMKNKTDEQNKITQAILNTQESERNFIAQELHDNVNQILAGTNLILSIAKNYPEKSKEHIESSMNNILEAIEENRKIAHKLITPDFETIRLIEQIESLAGNMFKTAGIDVYIDTSQFRENLLNDKLKLSIYRIAQEQCTNIAKYAHATMVNISLEINAGIFKMIIEDNGKGMEKEKKKTGIGLKNIRARLYIYNGEATIKSSPGQGFSLEIKIPLQGEK
jgi:PAS domain S-box-containing protein